MNHSQLKEEIEKVLPEVVSIRRQIHQNPEIGRTEFKTTALIKKKLEEFGVDKIESLVETGAVAYIKGHKDNGKVVALRADIDALPVTEETGLPYASQTPGVMHACGHDMHTSMLLGAAKILAAHRDDFEGTVKLIFQHSEDTLPGGAKELVEKGIMEDVDAIFGMHLIPEDDLGVVNFKEGPLTTSVDLFNVKVKGKSGHGSTPHLTIDPLLAACQMVVLLQQIQSRYVNPMETVIYPVCSFHSGDAPNIIPEEAEFSGVARSYRPEVRKEVTEQVYQIAKGVEAMSGAKVEINHVESYPACFNNPELTRNAYEAVKAALGEEHVCKKEEPFSFSEDFSYYTENTGIPGAYFMLNAGHIGEKVALHNCKLAMKEEVFPYGIATWVTVAENYLNGK